MEKNLDEAVKWLRKAAELGHKDAMVKLGELLSGKEEPSTKLLEKSYMEGYADAKTGKANKYLKVGDIITFGNYWEGKDISGGRQPVEWQVLDIKDGKALVISKRCLINHEYCGSINHEYCGSTWETCTLRKWLNGDFKWAIFSEEEMKAVMLSDVSADENPIYNTNQGKDTKDKLFLLSIKEVEQYFVSNEERWCVPTEYAYDRGFCEDDPDFEYGWWWLRSAGFDSDDAARVKYDGSIDCFGTYVGLSGLVRPAFWLNLQIYYTISEK